MFEGDDLRQLRPSKYDDAGSAAHLGRIAQRASELERDLIFSAAPQQDALGQELIAIALQARRHSA